MMQEQEKIFLFFIIIILVTMATEINILAKMGQ